MGTFTSPPSLLSSSYTCHSNPKNEAREPDRPFLFAIFEGIIKVLSTAPRCFGAYLLAAYTFCTLQYLDRKIQVTYIPQTDRVLV